MKIVKHRLVEAPVGIVLEYREDPDVAKAPPLVGPELVVIHYAVAETARATAAVLDARDYVSAHVSIDGSGRVIQQVPFGTTAWHAGESLYRGRDKVSRFSIGIEIANPGPLVLRGSQYFTTYGKLWLGGVVEAWHKNDKNRAGWRYWAEYSQTEIDLAVHLCVLLRQTYPSIVDVVGHDDVSPGRKADPGPAFPMRHVLDAVFPERANPEPPSAADDEEDTRPDLPGNRS